MPSAGRTTSGRPPRTTRPRPWRRTRTGRRGRGADGKSGREDDLDRPVLLGAEDLVAVRSLLEREPMGRQVLGAERVRVVLEQRQDVVAPAADVRLPHPQLDLLVEQ